jgi:3'-phosphoadenosine 5'-phosphosulfate sulfotransferase (PAPS reductase)/FAD synthetase
VNIARVNPVLEWAYSTVWAFIHGYSVPYCALYDQARLPRRFFPPADDETKLADFTERAPARADETPLLP